MIDNLEVEESKKMYKKIWNNKTKIEDIIASIDSLDFT